MRYQRSDFNADGEYRGRRQNAPRIGDADALWRASQEAQEAARRDPRKQAAADHWRAIADFYDPEGDL